MVSCNTLTLLTVYRCQWSVTQPPRYNIHTQLFSSSNIQCTKVSLVHVDMSLLQLTPMIGLVQTSVHLALVQGFVHNTQLVWFMILYSNSKLHSCMICILLSVHAVYIYTTLSFVFSCVSLITISYDVQHIASSLFCFFITGIQEPNHKELLLSRRWVVLYTNCTIVHACVFIIYKYNYHCTLFILYCIKYY